MATSSTLQTLTPNITFTPDWSPGLGGGVWSTAVLLTNYFQTHPQTFTKMLSKKSALELGSGNGYLSVVLSTVVKDLNITCTDTPSHLPLISKTFSENSLSSSPSRTITVSSLLWGAETLPSTFDFIFGTDVVYRPHLYLPFLSCLKSHLSPLGTAIIGICMTDTTSGFFEECKRANFRYQRVSDSKGCDGMKGVTFSLYVIEWKP
mmetsp:Transcript_14494/g.26826  ORF Transcript_14494/g.26826 Transcript_14494/m.26826 type:complete len:206 (-) Transcript_14494:98-715(-)